MTGLHAPADFHFTKWMWLTKLTCGSCIPNMNWTSSWLTSGSGRVSKSGSKKQMWKIFENPQCLKSLGFPPSNKTTFSVEKIGVPFGVDILMWYSTQLRPTISGPMLCYFNIFQLFGDQPFWAKDPFMWCFKIEIQIHGIKTDSDSSPLSFWTPPEALTVWATLFGHRSTFTNCVHCSMQTWSWSNVGSTHCQG